MNYLEMAEAYEMIKEPYICNNCEEALSEELEYCTECYEDEMAIKLREAIDLRFKGDTKNLILLHNAIDNAEFVQH